MKVIDVLNKIANNEVKFGERFLWHYRHGDIEIKYIERCGAPMLAFRDNHRPNDEYDNAYIGLFERYNYQILNDEVEKIEEDKDIQEIKVTKDDNCKRFIEYDDKTGHHKYTIRLLDEYFSNKINELVRVVNRLKDK